MIEVKEISFKTWEEFETKINEYFPELRFVQIAKLTEFNFSLGYSATVIFK